LINIGHPQKEATVAGALLEEWLQSAILTEGRTAVAPLPVVVHNLCQRSLSFPELSASLALVSLGLQFARSASYQALHRLCLHQQLDCDVQVFESSGNDHLEQWVLPVVQG